MIETEDLTAADCIVRKRAAPEIGRPAAPLIDGDQKIRNGVVRHQAARDHGTRVKRADRVRPGVVLDAETPADQLAGVVIQDRSDRVRLWLIVAGGRIFAELVAMGRLKPIPDAAQIRHGFGPTIRTRRSRKRLM